MNKNTRSMVRILARNLRYQYLERLIGVRVELPGFDASYEIIAEGVRAICPDIALMHRVEDTPLKLHFLFSKYGFLDVKYEVQSPSLESVQVGGVPLLSKLGFVSHQDELDHLANEFDDSDLDEFSCLGELCEEIARSRLFLLIWLSEPKVRVGDEFASVDPFHATGKPKDDNVSHPGQLPSFKIPLWEHFPISLTVTDACLTNTASAWINRHFYL